MNKATTRKIKIILKFSVHNCGKCGEIVEVRPGYARYLIDGGRAEFATPSKIAEIAQNRIALEQQDKEYHIQAQRHCEVLQGLQLVFERKASEHGRLFGSVSTGDFTTEVLNASKIKISKCQVNVPIIKSTGEYEVAVHLSQGVTAKVKINVTRTSHN